MMTIETEAAETLAAMRDARVRANGMRRLPTAYHFAFGATMGGWLWVQSLPPWGLGLGLLGMVAACTALYHWQRRATGRFINGFRSGRTLAVSFLMIGLLLGLLLVSNPVRMPTFNLLTPVQGAWIAFFAATALDWLWVKVYDAEQRAAL